MKSSLVDIRARKVVETEKAYKFDFGLKEQVWIPKSQCEWDAMTGKVTMEEDLAIEKGLDNLL